MTQKIDPMSIYGPEHFDSYYFESLKRWLSTQNFRRGVEIGFAWGMSATAYLETQTSMLISIDINDDQGKADGINRVFPGRWKLILGDSSTTLRWLPGMYDYIYIDGDHDYQPVLMDLIAANSKLDNGGVIVCDDYGNPCGVKQAVDEFCEKFNYDLEPMPDNPNGGVILRRRDAQLAPAAE